MLTNHVVAGPLPVAAQPSDPILTLCS